MRCISFYILKDIAMHYIVTSPRTSYDIGQRHDTPATEGNLSLIKQS